MAEHSPELAELKKQSAMMAPRHAANAGVAMLVVATLLFFFVDWALPGLLEHAPAWAVVAYFVVALALGMGLGFRQALR